jgi:predicted TPR repeat methyltransferase
LKNILKKIDNFLFRHLEDDYIRELKKECNGCETILDVGCGAISPIQYFSQAIKYSVGIDSFAPSIEKSKAAGIHNKYFLMDVMEISDKFPKNSFDYVVALDLFEHLEKNDGYRLIPMMENIARKKIVIFTPNGFQKQGEFDFNSRQVHLSGWKVDEMRAMGFRVIGINGWKPLRGELAHFKVWPNYFWSRISLLTQLYTVNHPKHAFALLCVKEKRTP